MIGKIVTALAGRSIAQTIGGTAAGPAGALIGAAIPVVLPRVARALGPAGMIAVAVGGFLFNRWLDRRNERQAAAVPPAGLPPRAPDAVLGTRTPPQAAVGTRTPPDALEGELLRD